MKKIYNEIVENILDCKDKNDLQDVIWGSFYDLNRKCAKNCGIKIKIGLICLICYGAGDAIFAIKLRNFLNEWYNADITIITTNDQLLIKLGADSKYVIGLEGTKSKNLQCRRLRYLRLSKSIPEQDLLFVAPITIDFFPSLNDVRSLFHYANMFNTFSFSEYNDALDKNFTFNMGVGGDRDGLFFTAPKISSKRLDTLLNPYVMIYVAESITNVNRCIFSFVELVAKKYSGSKYNYKKLDIIVPNWFNETIIKKKYKLIIEKYYDNIDVIYPGSPPYNSNLKDRGSVLTFRADILPVANPVMLNLMKNSLKDILLTGDQSVSDVLSCCPKKNLWYQVAPWKESLGNNLSKLLPNVYIKHKKTSCGTLKAIKYKSNYSKFIKDWNFKAIGKPKLDAIILSIVALKEDDDIKELSGLILKSRSLNTLKDRVEEF